MEPQERCAEAPRSSLPVCGKLLPPEGSGDRETLGREHRLREFVADCGSFGFLVDRPHGRRATANDWLRLSGTTSDGVPNGKVLHVPAFVGLDHRCADLR